MKDEVMIRVLWSESSGPLTKEPPTKILDT